MAAEPTLVEQQHQHHHHHHQRQQDENEVEEHQIEQDREQEQEQEQHQEEDHQQQHQEEHQQEQQQEQEQQQQQEHRHHHRHHHHHRQQPPQQQQQQPQPQPQAQGHFEDERQMERSPPPSYANSLSHSNDEMINLNENENQENERVETHPDHQQHQEGAKIVENESGVVVGEAAAGAAAVAAPPVMSTLTSVPSFDPNRAGIITREDSGLNEFTTIPSTALLAMNPRFTKAETNITLEELFERYEIGEEFGKKLDCLKDFKVVFILDDSSSMKHLLEDSPLLKLQPRVARWNELQYFANIALQLANFYDSDGCDVQFLNKQPGLKNCRSLVDLNNFFKHTKPKGFTPLTSTLRAVLDEYADLINAGRKLLTIIVTDGEPTDAKGNSDIKGFRKCLKSRPPNVYTNIVACTDQDDSIRYLNRIDRRVSNVDVLDDYRSEKEEVRKARGRRFQFTYGDYVCKALIGSVDRKIDKSDERGPLRNMCKVS